MKRPPTDLEVLEEIYHRYYDAFSAFSHDCPKRDAKVYVPIDIAAIAKHLPPQQNLWVNFGSGRAPSV